MTDTRTVEQRRRIMQSVRAKNTGPELMVRRALHAAGYRFRLHYKPLPGSPDIVFPGRKKAVFVHGCFWHGHNCPKNKPSKSRLEYWEAKLVSNIQRDNRNLEALKALGWNAFVIWECSLVDIDAVMRRLTTFLDV